MFVDSVDFIVNTCDMKKNHYIPLKEAVELQQLSTSFHVNFEVCLKDFLK